MNESVAKSSSRYLVRYAQEGDLPEVLRLCRERPFYDLLVVGAEQHRQLALGWLEKGFEQGLESDEAAILVCCDEEDDSKVLGYAVLTLGTNETITQEPQTVITGCAAPTFEILQALVETAIELTKQ